MHLVSELLQAKGHEVWSVTPDTLVYDSLKLMADKVLAANTWPNKKISGVPMNLPRKPTNSMRMPSAPAARDRYFMVFLL